VRADDQGGEGVCGRHTDGEDAGRYVESLRFVDILAACVLLLSVAVYFDELQAMCERMMEGVMGDTPMEKIWAGAKSLWSLCFSYSRCFDKRNV
jgi:hypothetical protein